ncbi:MAG: NAD(P)H-dependent oxidoreductase [Gemmatimonadaceae bacterium]|nr:NAD(P)H-dependent oxidoreductase [Gemmatimonadaceae bacterium]
MAHLLTVSGSLRVGSSNSALLAAAAACVASGVTVAPFVELASLPAFNPDEEAAGVIPASVLAWRRALTKADAVLFSSPEYAHGIPGALKNALDWIVGSGEMVNKPVGVLSASAASQYAHPQLVEVLHVMSARIIPSAVAIVDIPRRGVNAAGLLADPSIAAALRTVVAVLMHEVV